MHPVRKTMRWIKKWLHLFAGLDELCHHAKFGEDLTTRAGCRCENMVFVGFFTGKMPLIDWLITDYAGIAFLHGCLSAVRYLTQTFRGRYFAGQFLLLCSLQLWQQLQRCRPTRTRVQVFLTQFTAVLRKQFAANDSFLREANGCNRALALRNAQQQLYPQFLAASNNFAYFNSYVNILATLTQCVLLPFQQIRF